MANKEAKIEATKKRIATLKEKQKQLTLKLANSEELLAELEQPEEEVEEEVEEELVE